MKIQINNKLFNSAFSTLDAAQTELTKVMEENSIISWEISLTVTNNEMKLETPKILYSQDEDLREIVLCELFQQFEREFSLFLSPFFGTSEFLVTLEHWKSLSGKNHEGLLKTYDTAVLYQLIELG